MPNSSDPHSIVRPFSCLILEDDAGFASLVADLVRQAGGKVQICGTLAAAAAAADHAAFDLLLLDNHLPDGKAYDFFERLSRRQPAALAVMITGAPDLTEAVALTRNGLFDYLTKPVDADVLEACLRRALLQARHREPDRTGPISLGESPAMREVLEQLRQAARHPIAGVLLTGESGVGKDVAARTLHQLTFTSKAEATPYVAVNCAALPAEMFEAELFGSERGAYTGADRRRPGLVAAAQKGTLFLDEIAEVPLGLQAKLLRFLEGREFRALGSTEPQPFLGRVVAATNKDLRQEVAAGRFREDLLFRIELFPICIPPLRERRQDIPRLAEELLGWIARKYDRQRPLLNADDLSALERHAFPGNVRELRNILERSLLRTPVESRWLVLDRRGMETQPPPLPPAAVRRTAAAPSPDQPLPPERADLTPIEAQEYRLIREAIINARGGIRRAAATIGLTPQALLRRLDKWPELRPPAS